MSMEWSETEEKLLIEFFAKHECLHNKHHTDYNYNRKNKLLSELVRDLNKISSGKKFKVDIVSSHWNELRNIYNQHKRQAMKNEVAGKAKVKSEPNWIWWRQMSNVFAGPTETAEVDRSAFELTADTANLQCTDVAVSSPAKKRRAKPEYTVPVEEVEQVAISAGSKRRITILPKTTKDTNVVPIKKSRRRTIHQVAVCEEEEVSPQSGIDDTDIEVECKIRPRKAINKRSATLTNSISSPADNRSFLLEPEEVLRKHFHATSPVNISPIRKVPATPPVNIGGNGLSTSTNVEAMDLVLSDSLSQSITDECASTAMFVKSRLRAYDDAKRQRIIFKIHELFYQEDVND